MSDDKTNRGPQDRARINVHEPYELSYWSKTLGVSPERLRQLVQTYGVSANTIKQVLGKK